MIRYSNIQKKDGKENAEKKFRPSEMVRNGMTEYLKKRKENRIRNSKEQSQSNLQKKKKRFAKQKQKI